MFNYLEQYAGLPVELTEQLGEVSGVVGYGLTEFSLEDPQTITLRIGSNDGVKIWIDGRQVHRNDKRLLVPQSAQIRGTHKDRVARLRVVVEGSRRDQPVAVDQQRFGQRPPVSFRATGSKRCPQPACAWIVGEPCGSQRAIHAPL